jgi:hypothetical protein
MALQALSRYEYRFILERRSRGASYCRLGSHTRFGLASQAQPEITLLLEVPANLIASDPCKAIVSSLRS